MMEFVSAEDVLKSARRLLTTEEIVQRINQKSRRNVFKELQSLCKHKIIIKLELRFPSGNFDTSNPTVLYKWIGE